MHLKAEQQFSGVDRTTVLNDKEIIVTYYPGDKIDTIFDSLGAENYVALGPDGESKSSSDNETATVYGLITSSTIGEPDDEVIFSGGNEILGDDEAKYQETES